MATNETFAIVEIFGHRKRAGRVTEVQRYGATGIQIEIPKDDGFTVEWYQGSSIFGVRECTEEEARWAAKLMSPPSEYRQLGPGTEADEAEEEEEEEGDEEDDEEDDSDEEEEELEELDEVGHDEPTFDPDGSDR